MKLLHEKYINDLYLCKLGSNQKKESILFIHGGPGLNAQSLISYTLTENLFESLNYNIIFYDQRNCGKSRQTIKPSTYEKQINDLSDILKDLETSENITCIIGHSYGAKLLADYAQKENPKQKLIFLATARDILTPRLNNIKLDLDFLKEEMPELYIESLKEMADSTVWEVSEKLAPYFFKNSKRVNRYWQNKEIQKKYISHSADSKYKINNEVFQSLREELYNGENLSLNLDKLTPEQYIVFIGYNDFIMSGHLSLNDSSTRIFYESAHYPHLEENEKLCRGINEFIQ